MSRPDSSSALNEENIAAWLVANPEFFVGRDDLLERLKVPHPDASRGAVSLLERQLAVARQRCTSVEERLHGLLGAARDTEAQYRQLRQLILALLEGESSEDALLQTLADQLAERFDIAGLALWRSFDADDRPQPPQYRLDEPRTNLLSRLLEGRHCRCKPLGQAHWASLLPTLEAPSQHQGSAAITRLAIGQHSGYLILASAQPERFSATQDTLFVDYLGEVVGRLLHAIKRTNGRTSPPITAFDATFE
ncbi:DUF484 family protein [Carnimonas nigrificans]|uniref:DUF484 family protein n=1 Tax=Carnimonas nigrificans TaxID=64323 RepID=UPI00046EEE84|nr:DUF484 family protein [Carnimonas nigrificans]